MDIIVFVLVFVYMIRGYRRGLFNSLYSIFGIFFTFYLTKLFAPVIISFFELNDLVPYGLSGILKENLEKVVPGEFDSVEMLKSACYNSKFGFLFKVVLDIILDNIEFSGTLSSGDIIGPTLNYLFVVILIFILLFIIINIFLRIFIYFSNKIINLFKLSKINNILGLILGGIKGIFISFLVLYLLSFFANVFMISWLVEFLDFGIFKYFMKREAILKIVNLLF